MALTAGLAKLATATGKVTEQYCKVEDFSSQYGGENTISYTATNLSHEPNIYPGYGDYTQACVLRTYGPWWKEAPSAPSHFKRTPPSFTSEDYIDISFETKVYPVKLDIYETYNPGAVVRILACDCSPEEAREKKIRWVTLWSGSPAQARQESRIFSPPLKSCPFRTNFLRLEFCHKELYYYTELDAVKLYGSSSPLKAQCPIHDDSYLSHYDEESDFRISNLCCCANNRSAADDTSKWDKLSLEERMSHMTMDGPPAVHKKDNGYFDSLPGEVIQLILSYLDVPSLCAASMTSTLFFHHCYDPLQYTEINLQPHWPLVSDSSLEYLESRCRHLQRLSLSWCGGYGQITTQGFQSFIRECSKELTTLQLGCCKFVNSDCIQIIANSCNNLLELDLQCCPKESAGFLQIMKLSSLQRLNLYRTNIDVHSIVAIIRSCSELEHLNLGSCRMINNFDDVAIELGKNCKNLKSLDLWRARTISDVGLRALANNCSLLEEIELGWCPEIRSGASVDCIVELIKKCKYLKKLFLCANRTVSDIELNALSQHSKHLQQLDVLGTREISQGGVRKMLDNCKNLSFLDVSFCANVDFAFLQQCKTDYPHVNIKKSFQDTP